MYKAETFSTLQSRSQVLPHGTLTRKDSHQAGPTSNVLGAKGCTMMLPDHQG